MPTQNAFSDSLKTFLVQNLIDENNANLAQHKTEMLIVYLIVLVAAILLLVAYKIYDDNLKICAGYIGAIALGLLLVNLTTHATLSSQPDKVRSIAERTVTNSDTYKMAELCHSSGCAFVSRLTSKSAQEIINYLEVESVDKTIPDETLHAYFSGKPVRLLSIKKKNDHIYGFFSFEDFQPDGTVTSKSKYIVQVNLLTALQGGLIVPLRKPEIDSSNDAKSNFEASQW